MYPKNIFIPSTYQAIRIVDDALRSLLTVARLDEPVIGACGLALHELLTKRVDHLPTGQIRVSLMVEPTSIVMETRDVGASANVDLTSVKSLVDEVSYFTENGQNIWRLVKHFPISARGLADEHG